MIWVIDGGSITGRRNALCTTQTAMDRPELPHEETPPMAHLSAKSLPPRSLPPKSLATKSLTPKSLTAKSPPASGPAPEDVVAVFRRLKERLEASRQTIIPLTPTRLTSAAHPHLRLVVDNDRTAAAAAT
ncbi:MAG: hypothetical protein ACR2PG_06360 [Hyphomicrobiaceae bacterium]